MDKLRIYVCEDETEQRIYISEIIKNYILKNNLNAILELSTGDADEMIQHVKKVETVGLYFLDVNLNCDKSGIELGRIIRQYDTRGFIVMVTSYSNLANLTFSYKIEAMDYIEKRDLSVVKTRIEECILTALSRLKDTVYKTNKKKFKFNILLNDCIC